MQRRTSARAGFAGLAFILLAGCYGAGQQAPIATSAKPVMPAAEARRVVAAERARLWKDPDSIRDAAAGDTYACAHELAGQGGAFMAKMPGSCMCIEANAKNAMGGYVGLRRTIAVFPDGGTLDTMDGGTKGYAEYCQNLTPFPELNGTHAAPQARRAK